MVLKIIIASSLFLFIVLSIFLIRKINILKETYRDNEYFLEDLVLISADKYEDFKRIAILESLTLIFFLIPLGYLLLSVFNLTSIDPNLYLTIAIAGLSLLAFSSLLNYLLLMKWFQKRNRLGRVKI